MTILWIRFFFLKNNLQALGDVYYKQVVDCVQFFNIYENVDYFWWNESNSETIEKHIHVS